MFFKILQISVENTCVAGPQACNFIKKRLQFKCFPVKFLRASFSTEQLWWLPFKIRNSNNLFKHVSAIFLTQNQSLITCNSHNDKLIWKCTHLLKKRVSIELFCSTFRTKSLPPFIWSKHDNFAVLFHFLKTYRYLAKSSRIYIFSVRIFLALLNDQSFSSFHWKTCLPFLSQVRHSILVDWLIFEDEQLWLVHLNLT